MNNLLFHVSNEIYSVLLPKKKDNHKECICLSENCFISYFGQYLYIFDKQTLQDNFRIREVSTEGLSQFMNMNIGYRQTIIFRSIPLGKEYRIYKPINIDRFCLGIAEHFNHLKGELEEKMMDYCIGEVQKADHKRIDFSERE